MMSVQGILKNLVPELDNGNRSRTIGPYLLTGQIGSGGMADIYSAVHKDNENIKSVAIKLMKDEHSFNPALRERFLNEGMIVDTIRHPNIVDIYHRGESENHLYIVMELLEGQTLGEYIRNSGKLDIDFSLNIMRQVTSALVAIHKAGVVHRDLKPDNIMLVDGESEGVRAKILDFGLAKTRALPQMTESGTMVGTICYLSPEQLYDNSYSPASDVYALGTIFYEAVTGVKSFDGNTVLEITQKILKKQPLRPGRLRADLPEELDNLILKMMAKNPEARPSAAELLFMLNK